MYFFDLMFIGMIKNIDLLITAWKNDTYVVHIPFGQLKGDHFVSSRFLVVELSTLFEKDLNGDL